MVKHDVQDVAPSPEYLSAAQIGQVFPDLYEPAKHVPTVHRFDTVFADHDGVAHDFRFVIEEHAVEQVVFASVLNAVPVPAVVLPPGHAVQLDAPAVLYDPATHWVPV